MTLVLNGTTGVSAVDGSASTPAIQGNDTNTGIFFPAADTVAIATGGTERARVDSSGNVGIGTSSPSGSANYKSLTISGTSGAEIFLNAGATNYGYMYVDNGGFRIINPQSGAASGTLQFYTANTERARIDSSGKLLLGTTGTIDMGFGTQLLSVRSTSTSAAIFDVASTVNEPAVIAIAAATSGYTSNVVDIRTAQASGTGYTLIAAASGGSTRFQVLGNGDARNSNGSYGTISDIKLKENVVDATPKLEKLNQVRIVNYNLKGDDLKQIGVIAQELEQIFPGMVDETPDRDAEGNDLGTTTKSVKMSVFVPMLIKAMQEQQALITSLTARIAALEGAAQ